MAISRFTKDSYESSLTHSILVVVILLFILAAIPLFKAITPAQAADRTITQSHLFDVVALQTEEPQFWLSYPFSSSGSGG